MTNEPKETNTSIPAACKKHVFIALGWIFFALGVIGAFLPVMPTVLFMILALWAFANGSEELHNWLYNHPRFGPSLQRWDKHRVIPLHGKIAAIGGMALSLIYVIGFSEAPAVAKFAATAFITFGAIYVITKPSREPVSETEQ
ncbi:YbaN family protein [Magnetovibrio sp. PR-2]|uniref:YbaN family protein n=1 Tax=Magnetovibrio sp. PR-2 TaxID=3120356 RepID=UPI002FCE2EC7